MTFSASTGTFLHTVRRCACFRERRKPLISEVPWPASRFRPSSPALVGKRAGGQPRARVRVDGGRQAYDER